MAKSPTMVQRMAGIFRDGASEPEIFKYGKTWRYEFTKGGKTYAGEGYKTKAIASEKCFERMKKV